jgi:glycosyltransferase involved in cell wall biosynthesis
VEAPAVSVITCVDERSQFLGDAYESLAGQSTTLHWEWLIQEDGPDPVLAGRFDDARVRIESIGWRAGAAAARNMALRRARASIVVVLDADDTVVDGALDALVGALSDNPEIVWAAGSVDRFTHDDGRRANHDEPTVAPGPIPPGTLESVLRSGKKLRPIACGSIAARTTHVRAAGGWMALPFGTEDKGLLLALSTLWSGVVLDTTTHRYRLWADQTTRSAQSVTLYADRQVAALQRCDALRAVHGQPSTLRVLPER